MKIDKKVAAVAAFFYYEAIRQTLIAGESTDSKIVDDDEFGDRFMTMVGKAGIDEKWIVEHEDELSHFLLKLPGVDRARIVREDGREGFSVEIDREVIV